MGNITENKDKTYAFAKSIAMFERATKVIPGGIYGHQSPVLCVPGSFPYFIEKAEGCRFWDVDGNEYIDYMCGYGPMVVGYNNQRVEQAAAAQQKKLNVTNLPGPLWVELAERLVKLIPIADWVAFAKNGSDMTTWSLQLAREYTKKKKVLVAKSTYHGTHAWCTPLPPGVTPEDRANIVHFQWNDLNDFMKKYESVKNDFAGVIVTPFRHEAFENSILPDPSYYAAIRKVCDDHNAILIMDDVRCTFRLSLQGSNEYFGFKPDMICMSKAIANGHPLSVAAASNKLKNVASAVYFTGTYWSASPPMAAAMACIDELEEKDGVAYMDRIGKMLMNGLQKLAQGHGLQVTTSGPGAIPYMTFSNEKDFRRMQLFSAEATKRGVFLHPHHNWFVSTAHTEDDINQTLEIADVAFGIVKQKFGG